MPLNEDINGRLRSLIEQPVGDSHEAIGWLAGAANLVRLLCPSPDHPYRQAFENVTGLETYMDVEPQVSVCKAMLSHLRHDAQLGLLTSLQNRARAGVFDDLLDQAEGFHHEGQQKVSGVLAAAIFEDTLRKIADLYEVEQSGVKVDTLITELNKLGKLSDIAAKRCRSAAGVRNAALHAQWDKFTSDDVDMVIRLARRLVEEHLA